MLYCNLINKRNGNQTKNSYLFKELIIQFDLTQDQLPNEIFCHSKFIASFESGPTFTLILFDVEEIHSSLLFLVHQKKKKIKDGQEVTTRG